MGNAKISVVITAGGSSSRMGLDKNKLLLDLNGKTVIERTIEKFLDFDFVNEIIVVSGTEIYDEILKIIKNISFDIKVVLGGNSREESTYNGIKATSNTDYIICHDGARPLVSREIILKMIDELKNYDAVITGVNSKDTIKIIDDEKKVVTTPNRNNLFNIQTPQIFKRNLILNAYENWNKNKIFITDDSSLLEKINVPIKLVEGFYSNIKITTKEDLYLAIELLNKGE